MSVLLTATSASRKKCHRGGREGSRSYEKRPSLILLLYLILYTTMTYHSLLLLLLLFFLLFFHSSFVSGLCSSSDDRRRSYCALLWYLFSRLLCIYTNTFGMSSTLCCATIRHFINYQHTHRVSSYQVCETGSVCVYGVCMVCVSLLQHICWLYMFRFFFSFNFRQRCDFCFARFVRVAFSATVMRTVSGGGAIVSNRLFLFCFRFVVL